MKNKIKNKLSAVIVSLSMICAVNQSAMMQVNALPNNWAAGDYAYRFYKNYNSSYISIPSDCANFGSQCLGEGKLDHKRVNTRKSDAKNWWYDFNDHSYSESWTSTTKLAKHLQSRGCKYNDYYTSKSSSSSSSYKMLSNCNQGDILICSNGTLNPLLPFAEHTLVVGEAYWIYNGPKRVVLYGHTDSAKYDVYLNDNKIETYKNYEQKSSDYWNKIYYSYRLEKSSNLSN